MRFFLSHHALGSRSGRHKFARLKGADLRQPMSGTAGRDQGIDSLRFILCYAVALLHTLVPDDGNQPVWVAITASVCRGAVPFFFIASGYFARIPQTINSDIVTRPLRRLAPIYLIWMLIYYLLDFHNAGKPRHLGIIQLLTGGTAFHLWFLPALGFAMIIVPLLQLSAGRAATWVTCILFACFNLAFVGYRQILGLSEIGGTRLMIAPLLFMIGMELTRRPLLIRLPMAICFVILSWIATLGEEFMIAHFEKGPLTSHSSVATTFVFGLAIFMFAKALPKQQPVSFLSKFGVISLGIYASHFIFIQYSDDIFANSTLIGTLLSALVTIIVSTLLCLVLNRFTLTRYLVK